MATIDPYENPTTKKKGWVITLTLKSTEIKIAEELQLPFMPGFLNKRGPFVHKESAERRCQQIDARVKSHEVRRPQLAW